MFTVTEIIAKAAHDSRMKIMDIIKIGVFIQWNWFIIKSKERRWISNELWQNCAPSHGKLLITNVPPSISIHWSVYNSIQITISQCITSCFSFWVKFMQVGSDRRFKKNRDVWLWLIQADTYDSARFIAGHAVNSS